MKHQFEQIIELLKSKDVIFENGLTNEEIQKIQVVFNIQFPPDLELFLKLALPASDGFVNWRGALSSNIVREELNQILDWPLRGILFDVENNEFWLNDCGEMPLSYSQKEITVKKSYINYPQLLPIYSHRYIPSKPQESDNPIFSVYQTDVIYYGFNLLDYFAKEFHFQLPENFNRPTAPIRAIPFWSNLVEKN